MVSHEVSIKDELNDWDYDSIDNLRKNSTNFVNYSETSNSITDFNFEIDSIQTDEEEIKTEIVEHNLVSDKNVCKSEAGETQPPVFVSVEQEYDFELDVSEPTTSEAAFAGNFGDKEALMPVEPMLPLPVPVPPVGFQLVRDPTSGHFLLIPTASLEQLQQAVVWPSYSQPSSHVLLPPLSPPPLAPLQLLSSASSDYLATSTTLHQHTQTHSTVFTDPTVTPLVTTLVFYQHPTNLILSQAPNAETPCKSQATSPVTCLTPSPEAVTTQEEESALMVQDASNQTETHIFAEEEQASVVPERSESPAKPDADTTCVKQDENVYVPESATSSEEYEKVAKLEDRSANVETGDDKIPASKPNISGLELLSNSIVEFENSRQSAETTSVKYESHELKCEQPDENVVESGDDVLKGIAHMTLKDHENEAAVCAKTAVDDILGGLGLLCGFAEQRFMEEVVEKQNDLGAKPKKYKKERRREVSEERRKEKRKLKRGYEYGPDGKIKRFKHSEFEYERHTDDDVINEREMEKIRENELQLERERLSVLKRVAGERGLAEKSKRDLTYDLCIMDCDNKRKSDKNRKDGEAAAAAKSNCSCKDERSNHRTYKNKECEDESRKYMSAVERDMRLQLPGLQRQYKEKQIEFNKLAPKKVECFDISKKGPGRPSKKNSERSPTPSPPLLDKMDTPPVKTKPCSDLLKPPTLCAAVAPTEDKILKCNVNLIKLSELPLKLDLKFESQKRKLSINHNDSNDSTPEKISSSKKRKVGRPKKLLSAPSLPIATETIVAKKPRSKSSLVGYLLAEKNRLQMQNKTNLIYSDSSPPKYTEEPIKPKLKTHKTTKPLVKVSALSNGNNVDAKAEYKSSKIRPKLKAEPKIKTYTEEEVVSEWEITSQPEEEPVCEAPSAPLSDTRCVLTAEHLSVDKLRVLTAKGDLFYAGQLTAIQAPDIYAISLDGERANRPHIMSREEILRDAIVEVSPTSTSELLPGTRLCAYWSQQYRCLYPGTVVEPGTPDPQLDLKFVCVEFDDGDSGRFALEDIRLLPADYPIIVDQKRDKDKKENNRKDKVSDKYKERDRHSSKMNSSRSRSNRSKDNSSSRNDQTSRPLSTPLDTNINKIPYVKLTRMDTKIVTQATKNASPSKETYAHVFKSSDSDTWSIHTDNSTETILLGSTSTERANLELANIHQTEGTDIITMFEPAISIFPTDLNNISQSIPSNTVRSSAVQPVKNSSRSRCRRSEDNSSSRNDQTSRPLSTALDTNINKIPYVKLMRMDTKTVTQSTKNASPSRETFRETVRSSAVQPVKKSINKDAMNAANSVLADRIVSVKNFNNILSEHAYSVPKNKDNESTQNEKQITQIYRIPKLNKRGAQTRGNRSNQKNRQDIDQNPVQPKPPVPKRINRRRNTVTSSTKGNIADLPVIPKGTECIVAAKYDMETGLAHIALPTLPRGICVRHVNSNQSEEIHYYSRNYSQHHHQNSSQTNVNVVAETSAGQYSVNREPNIQNLSTQNENLAGPRPAQISRRRHTSAGKTCDSQQNVGTPNRPDEQLNIQINSTRNNIVSPTSIRQNLIPGQYPMQQPYLQSHSQNLINNHQVYTTGQIIGHPQPGCIEQNQNVSAQTFVPGHQYGYNSQNGNGCTHHRQDLMTFRTPAHPTYTQGQDRFNSYNHGSVNNWNMQHISPNFNQTPIPLQRFAGNNVRRYDQNVIQQPYLEQDQENSSRRPFTRNVRRESTHRRYRGRNFPGRRNSTYGDY